MNVQQNPKTQTFYTITKDNTVLEQLNIINADELSAKEALELIIN